MVYSNILVFFNHQTQERNSPLMLIEVGRCEPVGYRAFAALSPAR